MGRSARYVKMIDTLIRDCRIVDSSGHILTELPYARVHIIEDAHGETMEVAVRSVNESYAKQALKS